MPVKHNHTWRRCWPKTDDSQESGSSVTSMLTWRARTYRIPCPIKCPRFLLGHRHSICMHVYSNSCEGKYHREPPTLITIMVMETLTIATYQSHTWNITKYLASCGNIVTIRTCSSTVDLIAMAIQLLGLRPQSILQQMCLYRRF